MLYTSLPATATARDRNSALVQDPKGRWIRAQVNATRGLNHNHNRMLKQVFKGAATTVISQKKNDGGCREEICLDLPSHSSASEGDWVGRGQSGGREAAPSN